VVKYIHTRTYKNTLTEREREREREREGGREGGRESTLLAPSLPHAHNRKYGLPVQGFEIWTCSVGVWNFGVLGLGFGVCYLLGFGV
jgi:hypothetical protein